MRVLPAAVTLVILLLTAPASPKQAAPAWPHAVTSGWLTEFRHKKWRLSHLINARQGLIIIHHITDLAGGPEKEAVTAERLCDKQLDSKLAQLEKRLLRDLTDRVWASCQNQPGPPSCRFGDTMEYATTTHMLFRLDEKGELRLDALLFLDGGSTLVQKAYRTQDQFVREKLTQLRRTDCANQPATPWPGYAEFRSR